MFEGKFVIKTWMLDPSVLEENAQYCNRRCVMVHSIK
jgi:hypothetical protein